MSVPVRQITITRFAKWTERFVREHATPVLAIGIGHDNNSGQIVITAIEDEVFDKKIICSMLRAAIDSLEKNQ